MTWNNSTQLKLHYVFKKNRIIEFNFLNMTSEIRDVIELFTFGGCNSYAFKTIPSCRIASPGIFENNFSTLFFLKKIF